ncbi:lambda exonuclease family protein [Allopontixanthobacter sediminis]|uniref:YqaJ-like viral recombinase n=1 Tax=Allopontixanthobacter sediminis TaxID=1689985 RepID=A0A845AZU5_9SPHN|nr:lambda exonuclease family protein [Allopontixanthobacter sediminis]MXP42952.1 YqaJ-like viral recombinase [Allopontixanthobacter sediminis]
MSINYHPDLIQGSDEWHQTRLGLLTASEVKLILTPTLKIANNEKTRAHVWEIAAQRISQYVEPTYIGDEMLRGHVDEVEARIAYSDKYAPVTECGFVTNDQWGFTLGCSPDGLVGDDGLIECKSRRQKYQVQTIVEHFRDGTTPTDYDLQVQTAMLVTGRKWCDLISYSGGLPMATMRIEPNPEIQAAIISAASDFEAKVQEAMADYAAALKSAARLIPTERKIETEMYV